MGGTCLVVALSASPRGKSASSPAVNSSVESRPSRSRSKAWNAYGRRRSQVMRAARRTRGPPAFRGVGWACFASGKCSRNRSRTRASSRPTSSCPLPRRSASETCLRSSQLPLPE